MLLAPSSRKYMLNVIDAHRTYRISSIVGRSRYTGVMVGMGQKDSYVG